MPQSTPILSLHHYRIQANISRRRTKQEIDNTTELTKGGIDALKSQISANTTDGLTNHASGLDSIRESAQQVHVAAKDAAEVAKVS